MAGWYSSEACSLACSCSLRSPTFYGRFGGDRRRGAVGPEARALSVTFAATRTGNIWYLNLDSIGIHTSPLSRGRIPGSSEEASAQTDTSPPKVETAHFGSGRSTLRLSEARPGRTGTRSDGGTASCAMSCAYDVTRSRDSIR